MGLVQITADRSTLFRYPDDIRKAIYTTNAIESLNSVIPQGRHEAQAVPSDDSAMKVVYLAIMNASKSGPCRSGTGRGR